ncbi:MAG: MarR family winged helix-turn-helix transcriptional regulator [bacterium]
MGEKIKEYVNQMIALLPDLTKAFRTDEPQEVLHMDISFPEICVLRQLSSNEEPTMSELGRSISMDLSTLTRTVDKLVEKEFVVRKPDPEDRRMVRVATTTEGRKIISRFEEQRKKKIESILRQMTSQERRDLLNIFKTLHARIYGKAE